MRHFPAIHPQFAGALASMGQNGGMKISRDDIQRLSVAERLELIGALWDSIEDSGEVPDLAQAQRTELERRLNLYSHEPHRTSGWSEVCERLERDE